MSVVVDEGDAVHRAGFGEAALDSGEVGQCRAHHRILDPHLLGQGDRGQGVLGVVGTEHRQTQVFDGSAPIQLAIGHHDIKTNTVAVRIQVDAADVGLGTKSVGNNLAVRDARDHGLHLGMVDAERGKAVEGNVLDKGVESVAQPIESAVMVQVLGIDVGDDRNSGRQPNESAVGFIGLGDHPAPAAEPRHKGMSLFIAEKGPGFKVSRKLEKLGYKGIDTAELVFEDYYVEADRLIGGEEGFGLKQVLSGLELGRINVAARGVGIAQATLDESVKYSQIRKTFGKAICEHQAIQLKLADMAIRVEAARLLTEQAAAAYDTGERCDMEAGMAKLFATEAAVENSMEAMRIHGAYGYSPEYNIERYYRDAPLLCIGEGTNEIQRLIIAKQLIARNPI